MNSTKSTKSGKILYADNVKAKSIRGMLKIFLAIAILLVFLLSINVAWIGPWLKEPEYWKPHLTYGDSLNTIYITTRTPQPCKLEVKWSVHNESEWVEKSPIVDAKEVITHEFVLENLTPGNDIKYHLEPANGYENALSDYVKNDLSREFTIPGTSIINAQENQTLNFAIYGDNRPTVFGTCNHNYMVKSILKKNPSFVINVGDIVQTGGNKMEWARFFTTGEPLLRTHPLMPAPGNHEYYSGWSYDQKNVENASMYLEAFTLPKPENYYAYQIARTVLISLDCSGGHGSRNDLVQQQQEAWLDSYLNELNASKRGDFDWIIVFFHYPIESSGEIHESIWTDFLGPIFTKYNISVDLFIVGHVHQYERIYLQSAKTWCILSAGGGAEIEQWKGPNLAPGSERIELSHSFNTIEIKGLTLDMKAFYMSGVQFDELILNKTVGGI